MRLWSVFFAVMSVALLGIYLYAPTNPEWWLPNTYHTLGAHEPQVAEQSVAALGREVDHLFMIVLWLTGITFVLVSVVFCYVAWKFGDEPGRKSTYTHGSTTLEVVWTAVPALILVFIAVYQLSTWAHIKYRSNAPSGPVLAEVTARQFQWITRYAGPDGKLRTPDDIITINDFHFYADEEIDESGRVVATKGVPTKILLRSEDVLHSFFLPQLRIKQDAVPGLTIPVWFDADRPGEYELVCAELCGWGHYKMRSKMVVHRNKAEFEQWLADQQKRQFEDGTGNAQVGSPESSPPNSNPDPTTTGGIAE
ncbi:cytochrome c oxidase, subunit II [Isosphaera pallida ATCC 43644]|uniref:Cytochrome c oxidase subunit 2 n=1 Tax=Isosphaera pallida (strain ATCC 43644 / DSM 9630 / IS1B) TaxID=575540 RepID=E8R2H3_ISOPI|nr:cytochrome c oxidase subunit II [Isosphaera pallida]ADV61458.1 cytochrome c oxidase, subunit II [Isosphaera pallida ATCC 43644]